MSSVTVNGSDSANCLLTNPLNFAMSCRIVAKAASNNEQINNELLITIVNFMPHCWNSSSISEGKPKPKKQLSEGTVYKFQFGDQYKIGLLFQVGKQKTIIKKRHAEQSLLVCGD